MATCGAVYHPDWAWTCTLEAGHKPSGEHQDEVSEAPEVMIWHDGPAPHAGHPINASFAESPEEGLIADGDAFFGEFDDTLPCGCSEGQCYCERVDDDIPWEER